VNFAGKPLDRQRNGKTIVPTWSASDSESLTHTLTGGWSPSYVTGGAPNGSAFITGETKVKPK
jgi:hypothetical protein